jgi:succinyl-CoA synthetase alpha subunit
MTLIYSQSVKAFTAAILVCGAIYLLEYRHLAGYMLLGTGCMGMVITVGSVIGWVDVVRNGRVIPPAKVNYS